MTPLKIGACLKSDEIAAHRDWLFDADRDVELQDFVSHAALTSELDDRISAARAALDGHTGRRGIHGPYEGLDMNNPDAELQPLITARFLKAVEVAERVGATQVVLHSPYNLWFQNHHLTRDGYADTLLGTVHTIMAPVVKAAETRGVTLVIENIVDIDPAHRRRMVESFNSSAIALSIDTGHAHIAHRQTGAPSVDAFVRDAGNALAHVHLQDVDGYADRHWAPGEGNVPWSEIFRALANCESAPHLVLELRHKSEIPAGFAHLKALGLAE
ncbi:MAG: sugar phosphate isomerase/epimerase family protein [Pseudomonadota bacterium]